MVQDEDPSDRSQNRHSSSSQNPVEEEEYSPLPSPSDWRGRERSTSIATSGSRRLLRPPRFTSRYLSFAQRRRDRATNYSGEISLQEVGFM